LAIVGTDWHFSVGTVQINFKPTKKGGIMSVIKKVAHLFYIKRTKLLKNGEAPVFLRILVDQKREDIGLGRSIDPRLWSSEKNGALGISNVAKDLNRYLDDITHRLKNLTQDLRYDGKEISALSLKKGLLGITEDELKVLQAIQEHNDRFAQLVGKEVSAATLQRYETVYRHVRDYILYKYDKPDIPMRKVDFVFLNDFAFYLMTMRNIGHNSTMKYIKNFKKIVRLAIANGHIRHDPFANFKTTIKKVDRGFLTQDELDKIINEDFKIDRLIYVRDCFVFACFTGLAYSDLKKLAPVNLMKGPDGKLWITAKRKKTDNVCNIPLLPTALHILEKYADHPYCTKKNLLLPVLSNQKLNAYLKEIAGICTINKELTTHMARHTFATTITLNNGIPIESVSKMLGHSSIKMTQIYARLLDNKVGRDMDKLNSKYTS